MFQNCECCLTTSQKDFIFLVALRNKKNRFLLPSQENYFGGLRIEAVMLDTGCNSLLCPIANEHTLSEMCKLFPKETYLWTIEESRGVQSKSLTLEIKKRSEAPITLELEKNLITSKSEVARLRFHLSAEDITNTVLRDNLAPNYIEKLKTAEATYTVQRRSHALIGQSLLKGRALVQFGDMAIVVDAERYPQFPINPLQDDQEFVKQNSKETKPETWDDLEDNDHDNDDLEYVPELDESDYYD